MPTNDGGDIQAATKAIELCAKQGITKMCINTDSPFLINAATDWISKWKSRDWQQTPVKNKVDFCLLDRVMTANKNVEVKWKYVPANTRVLGNERVKTLAKEGALKNRVLGICSVCKKRLLIIVEHFFASQPAASNTVPKDKPKIVTESYNLKITRITSKGGTYEFLVDSNQFVHVYTDGACKKNGRRNASAGIGVYFDEDHPL